MGHVRSKPRSLGQILQTPCVCSKGHNFSLVIIKLGQNVCLDEILDESENGSCQVKKNVTRSSLRKTLCTLQRPHFQFDNLEIWSECLF